MASHRLNPLYAIKECSSCGSLYTRECCSIGSLENKILVPEPESSPCCAKCGTPVDGPYCRGCAFLRKKFEEDLLTYCGENETSKDFEDISESSDDNTNVVNAPREPIVVNQDPGEKSSQGPPLINQNCCYECGDSLDGIFCQQCICKFCGKGAHYGYNCPPKVLIISNPEQCNQTINELPQILPNVHPTCNYEDENSFIYDSKPHSFNVSPSVFNQPPQPQFETYLCELCGNNAHYGYDCSPQFPFVSKVRKKEQSYKKKYYAAHRYMLSIPFVDEDDYIPLGDIIAQNSTSKAITPDLPIEEPDNSLNMGDEHLDTIPATESDEVIKSSVENLVPIPSEFEGISDDTSDIDLILKEFAGKLTHIAPISPEIVEADFDPNDDTSSDDDDFEDIELLKITRLITNIESLKDKPTPDCVLNSPSSFLIPFMDSDAFFESLILPLSLWIILLPVFETFNAIIRRDENGSSTTHAKLTLFPFPELESISLYDPFILDTPPEPSDVRISRERQKKGQIGKNEAREME
ncbi:hypothetical protein Tco_0988151 [Tanacetum coccineum]|uniref:CCHC-type domain-containing protein n=1 Tax=Tanacetum coccineum TaxID=301880 RepID=A0ABQ5ERF5_9ASTR